MDLNDDRTASAIYSIWWQVALGGFLALGAHSLLEAAWAKYQLQQLEKQLTAEMRRVPTPYPSTPAERQRNAKRPIGPDERCIEERRFKRVENGWKQINEPC